MIGLAEFERRLRDARDLSVFDDSHLHRAEREDDWGVIKTRDRVRAASLADLAEEAAGAPILHHDLRDMIVFETAQGWRGHRWIRREGERIARETLVIDGIARARALDRDPDAEAVRIAAMSPVHAPLGELRPGRGQLATAATPDLPGEFPEAATPEATRLHRLWNARALDLAADAWLGPAGAPASEGDCVLALIARLPDATIMIERGLATADTVAILWRLHGHDHSGARVRAIGSSIAPRGSDADGPRETMLDMLSITAQPLRPVIDYGG